jgi:hypothetical protein
VQSVFIVNQFYNLSKSDLNHIKIIFQKLNYPCLKDRGFLEKAETIEVKIMPNKLIQQVISAEDLAKRFHYTYEALAPQFNYETRKASAKRWEEIPENNRQLMIAVSEGILTFLCSCEGVVREKQPLENAMVKCPDCKDGTQRVVLSEAKCNIPETAKSVFCKTCNGKMQIVKQPLESASADVHFSSADSNTAVSK